MKKHGIDALRQGSKTLAVIFVIVGVTLVLLYVQHFLSEMAEKEAEMIRLQQDKQEVWDHFCNNKLAKESEVGKWSKGNTCVEAATILKTSPQWKAFLATLDTEYRHIPFVPWCLESGWCMGYIVYQVVDLIKIAWMAFISQATLLLFLLFVVYKYLYPAVKGMATSLKNMEQVRIDSKALDGLPTTATTHDPLKIE